jgi:glucose-1-phosphate adenylyltransferase
MLSFHKLNKADVTVGVIHMPTEKARRFGTVTVGNDNRILDFVEKAETPKNNLVSMGIYVFDVEAIAARLYDDAKDPDSAHDFGYSIVPAMVKHDRAFAYQFDGYWRDIGTIESYYEANRELACRQSSFSLDGTWPIATAQERLSVTKVSSEGKIYNSVVSPGCVIKGCVENSVLSPGVWVAERAVVRNSVLMGNVFIDQHSRVESCIIDERVSLGRFCRIGAKSGQPIIPEDITVLEKDLTVPSGTSIRPNESDLLEDNMTEYTTASHATELSCAVAR